MSDQGHSTLWVIHFSHTSVHHPWSGPSRATGHNLGADLVRPPPENLSFNDAAIKTHNNTVYLHRWKLFCTLLGWRQLSLTSPLDGPVHEIHKQTDRQYLYPLCKHLYPLCKHLYPLCKHQNVNAN